MPVQTRKLNVELISRKSRRELQEYFVGTTLRVIEHAFDDAGIACDLDFRPSDSGERRCKVQQYYHTLDFSKWDDVRQFLTVYANVLLELEQPNPSRWLPGAQEKVHNSLKAFILKDGFDYRGGKIVPVGSLQNAAQLKEVAVAVDAPYLLQQVERIEHQIDADPRLAIGTSKELIETVCKTILTDRGVDFDKKAELMELVKLIRGELKLVPDDIPDSAKAADTIRKLLGNLASITQSVNGARIVQRMAGSRRSAEKCSAHVPDRGFVAKTCDGKSITSPTNREKHECTKTCICGPKSDVWC